MILGLGMGCSHPDPGQKREEADNSPLRVGSQPLWLLCIGRIIEHPMIKYPKALRKISYKDENVT